MLWLRRSQTLMLFWIIMMLASCATSADTLPRLAVKSSYRVGFSQTGNTSPWRLAETASMKDEAAKRGYELIYTDAEELDEKQLADIDYLIGQDVDVLFIAPRSETALGHAVIKAKQAGIPVILLDRDVDHAIAQPGRDYVTVIQSDFVAEGSRAADWLIAAMNGNAIIVELEGTTNSTPAKGRKQGFAQQIKAHPGMQIVAAESADFTRDQGRRVMTTLLEAHPNLTAVYAHNDEMAIGAIAALEAAGKIPGKDVIVVSIDGERDALQAIIDGTLGASVECNPRFGPIAFDTLDRYARGEAIPPMIINPDRFFDRTNAQQELQNAY